MFTNHSRPEFRQEFPAAQVNQIPRNYRRALKFSGELTS